MLVAPCCDHAVEYVAGFFNLADRYADLAGNAKTGEFLLRIWRRRGINRAKLKIAQFGYLSARCRLPPAYAIMAAINFEFALDEALTVLALVVTPLVIWADVSVLR